jgi:uncharacterized paraquat-inducible protein A
MGKMKEIFMEMIEHEYHRDHYAYLENLNKQRCEEFDYVNEQSCPNCHNYKLHRNKTEAACDACGQEFIYVENTLRFK